MARHLKNKKSPETAETAEIPFKKISSANFVTTRWKLLLQALVIVAAGLWIYWPVLHGDWLWDDDFYITANPLINDPARLWKAWFQPGSFIEYYPIEESVQWLQWQIWHKDTFGYHATNIILHIVNALLVWKLFNKLGLRLAWWGGLIFAIHPVMVESVAWIAELKNTLSLLPFLLSMCAWINYEEHRHGRDYLLALGFFLMAMFCKITMAPFPVLILVYAWWKRSRITWNDVGASVPFFIISLVLGMTTIWAGACYAKAYHMEDTIVPVGGIFSTLALVSLSISFYLSIFFWPTMPLPLYPQWIVDPPSPLCFLPGLALLGVIYWLWSNRRSWGRHGLLGLSFFLLTLAPFLGFLPASYMRFTWVMDHFLYIPSIGLIGLILGALGQIEKQIPQPTRPYSIALLGIALALLAFESRSYAGKFLNQESLWAYATQHNPKAWFAHCNLGSALQQKGQVTEAIEQYRDALRIKPDEAEVLYNLGSALLQIGQLSESKEQLESALKLRPGHADAHNDLGNVLLRTNQIPEAIEQYEQALRCKPNYAEAHHNLANAFLQAGRIPEAIEQDAETLKLKPDDADVQMSMASSLLQSGQVAEAIQHDQQALKTNPNYAEAHDSLGIALVQNGQISEAIEQYEKALKLKPNYAEAHYDYGNALLQSNRLPEAMEQYKQALKINPNYAEAHNNYGAALLQSSRTLEAIEQFKQALKINPNNSDARMNLEQLQGSKKESPAKK